MNLDFVDSLPPSLVSSCAGMTLGCPPDCARACRLGDAAQFDAVLDAFAARFHDPDRAALVSFWSLYYLAPLIVPSTAALLCRDRILPVGFEELGLATSETGIAAFLLPHGAPRTAGACRFETLVDGHLAPFAALCASRTGLSPRIVWANAAAILDWALGELEGVDTVAEARAEARALLDGGAGACRLAYRLRRDAQGACVRRVCCLRYRLPGVPDCGALCPRNDMASAGRTG